MAPPGPAEVARTIADEIRRVGPMRFDRFMELALYGPGGYYDAPPIGPSEAMDFVTSPHVHPIFGELVAEALRHVHVAMGSPTPFDLIELGAGDGTLLRVVGPALADLEPRIIAVERSPGARDALSAIDGVEVLGSLPPAGRPSIVLAHEVLDNQPFRRLVSTPGGADEVYVDLEGETFVERRLPAAILPAPIPSDGGELVLQERAADVVVEALAGPPPRAMLAIDYGTPHGAGGPVHGYASHRVVDDLVSAPGTTDITAGVDFGALAAAASAAGLRSFPSVSQHDALVALGVEERLRTELEHQKVLLREGRGAEAVRVWGGRSRATLLADPAGLGRFRWFVATTTGVDEPAWLTRAASASSG
jgi:SAM-dependent MidA family methyltransferase